MDYLKELCTDLKINVELQTSEKGTKQLPITPSLKLEIKTLNPGFYLSSPICPCPEVKKEQLFIQLMKANLFGQGTLGATIGLAPDQNLLTLSLALAYDMDYRAFKEAVEDFTNIVMYWRDEVDLHIKQAQNNIL